MARIRTIKPDFWTDEKIVELSAFARLLFIGLWNFADDEGRLVFSPKKLKMQIFPSDSVDMSELFGEIRREGLISIYVVDYVEYLQIKGFAQHQKIDKRTASKLPANTSLTENSPEFPRIPTTEVEVEVEGKGRDKSDSVESTRTLKTKTSKKTKTPIPENFGISDLVLAWAQKNNHQNLEKHFESFVNKCKAKGYEYADWDAALRNAISSNWANIPTIQTQSSAPEEGQTRIENGEHQIFYKLVGWVPDGRAAA